MTPEEAKKFVADYDKSLAFFEKQFPDGLIVSQSPVTRMSAKEFIDTQYLYDEKQRKKLEEAKLILAEKEDKLGSVVGRSIESDSSSETKSHTSEMIA